MKSGIIIICDCKLRNIIIGYCVVNSNLDRCSGVFEIVLIRIFRRNKYLKGVKLVNNYCYAIAVCMI